MQLCCHDATPMTTFTPTALLTDSQLLMCSGCAGGGGRVSYRGLEGKWTVYVVCTAADVLWLCREGRGLEGRWTSNV